MPERCRPHVLGNVVRTVGDRFDIQRGGNGRIKGKNYSEAPRPLQQGHRRGYRL